jgi:hypothetical protein
MLPYAGCVRWGAHQTGDTQIFQSFLQNPPMGCRPDDLTDFAFETLLAQCLKQHQRRTVRQIQ